MVGYRKSDLIWKDDGDASVVCGIIECDKLEFSHELYIGKKEQLWKKEQRK